MRRLRNEAAGMLEGMKTLLVILLIAYGQAGLAQDREAVQAFVGCYELRVAA
jgi:hypothetical protein